MAPRLSVVVPVFNERDNLGALLARLEPVLAQVSDDSYEVVFVDDGSTDGSETLLDTLHSEDRRRRKVVHLSRNFGQQAALQAGLAVAGGDAVVLMDADLQDRPEAIRAFVARWREGYDVVYGVRSKRKEALWRRGVYALFYRTLRAMSQIDMPLDAGDFCLLDRRVVNALAALPERPRYLRGLRSWVGFRQIGVSSEHDLRHSGRSKYDFRQRILFALEGYLGFSALPLRLAALMGLVTSLGGFAVAVAVIWSRLTQDPTPPHGWASLLACVMVVGGVQLLMLGVVGEYLSRVYDEVRGRPLYVVRSGNELDEVEARRERSDVRRLGGSERASANLS